MKCKWEKDVHGFYVTPLIGVSKRLEVWQLWVGWLYWLWTWTLNDNQEIQPTEESG